MKKLILSLLLFSFIIPQSFCENNIVLTRSTTNQGHGGRVPSLVINCGYEEGEMVFSFPDGFDYLYVTLTDQSNQVIASFYAYNDEPIYLNLMSGIYNLEATAMPDEITFYGELEI